MIGLMCSSCQFLCVGGFSIPNVHLANLVKIFAVIDVPLLVNCWNVMCQLC